MQNTIVVRRRLAALGIADVALAKAHKDLQSAVRHLESSLTSYSDKLVTRYGLSPRDDGEVYDDDLCLPVNFEIESNGGKITTTSNIASQLLFLDGQQTIDELTMEVVEKFKDVHGPVGWLNSTTTTHTTTSVPTTTTTPTTDAPTTASAPTSNTHTTTHTTNTAKSVTESGRKLTPAASSPKHVVKAESSAIDAINDRLKGLKEDERAFLLKSCDEVSCTNYLLTDLISLVHLIHLLAHPLALTRSFIHSFTHSHYTHNTRSPSFTA